MIEGIPVIDAVVHPYNLERSNFRNAHAEFITEIVSGGSRAVSRPGYRLTQEAYERDWPIEEVANMSFVESYADLAAYHVLPIKAYHDGMCSLEKGLEARRRWPNRFYFYVGVDPLEGPAALDSLEQQVEAFGDVDVPVGLKLYPNSWVGSEISSWYMDDPEVAFPIFERAEALGIRVVAVHKALPLGPVEMRPYGVADIDRAAMAFPNLQFEIVHGGMAFVEETAWQLDRFPNVWVNLEVTAHFCETRPYQFESIMATLASSPEMRQRLLWGTGCMAAHPRPQLEAFMQFQFSDRLIDGGMPRMTRDDKADILARNYARLHRFDLDEHLARAAGDEFERRRGPSEPPVPPYSTTSVSGQVS